MKRRVWLLMGLMSLLAVLAGGPSAAQEADPGVASAMFLLEQATEPQQDGSHNTMLLGLRQLDDPALLPMFKALVNSPYLSMRIHGQLGGAALSPQRRIDLTKLAEIEDPRELVQVLSAAIDDDLIDNAAMTTLLTWEGLELPLRQAVALRLIGEGGKVDTKVFSPSLDVELNRELSAGRLLQYALAGLLFAQSGEDAGKAALAELAGLQGKAADAVIAQVLDAAMRQDFASAGPLGMTVAKDASRDSALRLIAVQSALRLQTPGAQAQWKDMYVGEESIAQRIRLAMIALDGAEHVDAALFDTLATGGDWAAMIGRAGKAIATNSEELAEEFEPLISTGQPLSVQWVVAYCRREKPDKAPALLELVITHHGAGLPNHRGRIVQSSIVAATIICEMYPQEAFGRLNMLLADALLDKTTEALEQRQIILMGIARAQSKDLKLLAESLKPDGLDDFTTDALRLFIRARHAAPLTDNEWDRVSDIVQGVGQLDPSMRLQLAWFYLKHKGLADEAIAKALK